MNDAGSSKIQFGDDGLIPVVAQDAVTGDVLMLAFMNDEALRRTRETGRAHYWSRSRGRLWRKGETSGNEQIVDAIHINCENNSLLLLVRQVGAVCHEGYPTCFYRRLEADDTLTTVREQAFDPDDVYGREAQGERRATVGHASASVAAREIDQLAEATRRQFGAYGYLRDYDLTEISGTSRRLRQVDGDVRDRIADELGELAGVLEGAHRHTDLESDVRLEASQVIYWVILHALRKGVSWTRLRPDRALETADEELPPATIARLLRADADSWSGDSTSEVDAAARAHATLAIVGQACRSGGIEPLTVIEADLSELRSRPYLTAFFGRESP
jgi:phosphoribosyl-AMP cyclohydrolase